MEVANYYSITGIIYAQLTLLLFFVAKRYLSDWRENRTIESRDIFHAFLSLFFVCLSGTFAGTIFLKNIFWIKAMIVLSSLFLSFANAFLGHLFLFYIKSKISPWWGFAVIMSFGLFVTAYTVYLPINPVVETNGGIDWGLPFNISILRTVVYVLGILPLLIIIPVRIKINSTKTKNKNNIIVFILLLFSLIIVIIDFVVEPLINAQAVFSEMFILLLSVVAIVIYGLINERIINIREKKINSIIYQLTDGFIFYNENGIITIWNDAAEKITGLKYNKAKAKYIWDVFYSLIDKNNLSDDYLLALQGYFISGFEQNLDIYKKVDDFNIISKSGVVKNVQIKIFPVITYESHNVGILMRDVTHDKIIEKQLITAKEKAEESSKITSSFLKTITHELRTPLNYIIGFSSIINENTSKEEVNDFVKQIAQNSDNLLEMIDNILDIVAIENGKYNCKFEKINVKSIFNEISLIVVEEQKKLNKANIEIKLITEKSSDNIIIETNKFRIIQIIVNLIKNALKYTEKGSVEYGYFADKDNLVIFIKDTGIGIPGELLNYIYDNFKQIDNLKNKKYGGLGLGLAIVKNFVKILHGDIRVESKEGEGSEFYITFPCEKK